MSEGPTLIGVPRIMGPACEPLSEKTREAAARLIARYPEPRSALMPLLYLVQAEHGFVSREGIREIADMLDLTPAEVTAVASFYTMFKRTPAGRWIVSVCTQPPCALAGAGAVREALEAELGIGCGQTTDDGVMLEEVECLCICDGAPVVAVNYENYETITPERAREIVRALRAGESPPAPERGEAPRPAAEIHTELSGLNGTRA